MFPEWLIEGKNTNDKIFNEVLWKSEKSLLALTQKQK
jgi:hypothetical protein